MILHGNNFCYLLQAGRNWVFLFVCLFLVFATEWLGSEYTETQDATLPFGSYLRGKNVAVRVEKQGSNCSLSHVSPGGGGVSV